MYVELKSYCAAKDVTFVVVSKTRSIQEVTNIYDQGHRQFAENRVQELVKKYEAMPKDISWHIIGHLQKNKVKYIAPFVSLIQSVDSLALAEVIDKQAFKLGRSIDILLQIKIAGEDSKTGYSYDQLQREVNNIKALSHINIKGVMGMGTFTSDEEVNRIEFQNLNEYFSELKGTHFRDSEDFKTISMGMSGDYKLAIEMGSNMVRIGSLVFSS